MKTQIKLQNIDGAKEFVRAAVNCDFDGENAGLNEVLEKYAI